MYSSVFFSQWCLLFVLQVTTEKSEESTPSPRKNTLSLFDDDDGGDDLFGGGAKAVSKGGAKGGSATEIKDTKPEVRLGWQRW